MKALDYLTALLLILCLWTVAAGLTAQIPALPPILRAGITATN